MINRLARAGVHVKNRAIALFVDIRLHGKFLGNLEHRTDERAIVREQVIQGWNMFFGHDQKVNQRLWSKVLECHHEVVLMYKVRGSITFNDSAKKARFLHGFNLALLGLLLCTTLLAAATQVKSTDEPNTESVKKTELLSYE